MKLHYQPKDGYAGDAIPFFHNGEYHIFYLKRFPQGGPYVWSHIMTKDLINYTELEDAVKPGPEEYDIEGCWTGSAIEHQGKFYIFYTGWNPKNEIPQTVCRATSSDNIHFTKDLKNPVLVPDSRWYELKDFRDPFVFWNPEEKCFWMLVCARSNQGPPSRRGVIALATSRDLENWKLEPPLWAPYIDFAPECPDMFFQDGMWHILFSTFGETLYTRHRQARSVRGHFKSSGRIEFLDCGRCYAMKSLSDGKRRFAFGWIPTRKDNRDDGEWEWGGTLSLPREVFFSKDGIHSRYPAEYEKILRKSPVPVKFSANIGNWKINGSGIECMEDSGFSLAWNKNIAQDFYFSARIDFSKDIAFAGIYFKAVPDLTTGYIAGIEPRANRIFVAATPGRREIVWRTITLEKCSCLLEMVVDGQIVEIFLDKKYCLSCRVHNLANNGFGLFVEDGTARFRNLFLGTL